MNKTDEGGGKDRVTALSHGIQPFPEKKEEEGSKYGCLVYFMFSPHFFSWESIEAPVPPFWPIGKESREEISREKNQATIDVPNPSSSPSFLLWFPFLPSLSFPIAANAQTNKFPRGKEGRRGRRGGNTTDERTTALLPDDGRRRAAAEGRLLFCPRLRSRLEQARSQTRHKKKWRGSVQLFVKKYGPT